MDKNKFILILIGIGITLFFLASYLWLKSPLDIFNVSIGVMVILFGFYNEDKKVNYLAALFCVNIIQWFILIYIFYYNSVYKTTEFYYYLIGALLFTIVLVNQIRKNIKSPENSRNTKINILKDKTKLILLFMGVIIIIGCLTGFIAYYAPIFLYGCTLGLMAFIYGFYREDKKVNVSVNYAVAMGSVFILQWFIIGYFIFTHQFSGDDFVTSVSFSIMITLFFLIQIRESDLKYIGKMRKKTIQ